MSVVKKVLKWVAIGIGIILLLIIIGGLYFRLFGPAPHIPEGQLVNVDGFKFHINAIGPKNDRPTVVIEGGAGLPTEFFHWLSEGLQDSLRVVRYDRAGIGHSDKHITPRDPETIARELHHLLEKAGESPPYLMAGHSMGGPYIRVFAQLYPDEVEGLFFIDATHHDFPERHNTPKESSFVFKAILLSIKAQAILADMGILSLMDRVVGTPYQGEGLPAESNARIKRFLANGKIFRAYAGEMKEYFKALRRSAAANDFGDIPIRSFTAIRPKKEQDGAQEDESKVASSEATKYVEFEDLSTNGRHIGIPGNHVTIFSKKENAHIICQEILKVAQEIRAQSVIDDD